MADNIKIQSVEESQASTSGTEDLGREYTDKLQSLGRTLISSLFMLVRSVKMYDPENAIFAKPLASLQENINQFIAVDGKLDLQMTRDAFYVNNMLVRMDVSALDNVRYLQA